ncbi:hypothetical protein POM88_018388 [Heracleum sosnowskyi]|uniref:DUS-like FMN-binding domain-containing protein n=1 Tax=Heracleum sosnowskyi TaxID=360622 RepID=A0AAD8MUN5_9APIA|nr:hypothetical protein POM88_018388 [Heracleum sosnowskyi]
MDICGCPSPKVAGRGCFGASLMLDADFVAKAMPVIAANSDVPVSVKCRRVLITMIHILSSVRFFSQLSLSDYSTYSHCTTLCGFFKITSRLVLLTSFEGYSLIRCQMVFISCLERRYWQQNCL